MRTKYSKYHERFGKIFRNIGPFFDENTLNNWGEYLSRRIPNENSFSLFYYTLFERESHNCKMDKKHTIIDRLYFSAQNNMNDVFEGIGGCPHFDTNPDEQITKLVSNGKPYAYMKSFSEDGNHNLMWSHYADNNKGICIEYDFSRIAENMPIWKNFFPVVYCDKREKEIDYGELFESLDRNELDWVKDTRGVFTQKEKIWKYEKEWRIVLTKADVDNTELNIEKGDNNIVLKFPFVSNVFLGPGLIEKQNDVISTIKKDLITQHDPIKVYQMLICDGDSYRLKKKYVGRI